ncbi:DNA-binding MarR family transcriptional regulator [Seleniivibrio woodruffii]|uniref:DNA-binding MarR family transcriptional regulator n=2 Tax=Seleniivibrio woodruffii TaxID=1078050 RepID=A0A4R1KAX1_9BACT|nr:DNA-binding MarR family transcriptional regulator [Seleniivibrio woodruffii]TVZ36691.1 DNA-binding MarR family transcriptional regulator [Seleniivibrio woodruffii]
MFLLKELPDKKMIKLTSADDKSVDASAVIALLGILKASGDVLVEVEKFFAKNNLSQSRYIALSVLISRPDGLFPYELADHMGISRATVSSVIKGLESSGYIITVKSGDDKRMKKISSTPEGKKIHESLLSDYYAILTGLFGVHDKKDIKTVNAVMKGISEQVLNFKNKGQI